MIAEVWTTGLESLRIPRQNDDARVQVKFVVRPEQTLQEPSANETRAAREKHGLATHLIPQPRGMVEDMREVFVREPGQTSNRQKLTPKYVSTFSATKSSISSVKPG